MLTEVLIPIAREAVALDGVSASEIDLSALSDGQLYQVHFVGDHTAAVTLSATDGGSVFETVAAGSDESWGTFEKGRSGYSWLDAGSATTCTVVVYAVRMGRSAP